MKRILINATQPEEIRVALVDGQSLYDLDIEDPNRQQSKSNIYKGVVTRVEAALEAAFVDYGAEKHGFLPFKEIDSSYLSEKADTINVGAECIVQIEKEERGNKGAALTTFLSLAGRYSVLLPNNSGVGGVSRRIGGEQRKVLKDVLEQLSIPKEHNIIIRTAGIGHSIEELQWDVNYLVQLWESIYSESQKSKGACFLFQESNIIICAIRDYLRPQISEIIVDEPNAYNLGKAFIQKVMPEYISRIKLHVESAPLYNYYQIERQIETAFDREVTLPSGGSIVIDITEALTSIDVNSARATSANDIEATAVATNLEAAVEVARQMRIRDLGGLFVIDFIDMSSSRNKIEVENCLHKALIIDRAKIQIGRISQFGLLEMSRQRLRPSLDEIVFHTCSRCLGQGRVRGMKSLGLSILRLVEEESQKDNTEEVRVFSSSDICTYLLNEKRAVVNHIEKLYGVRVLIIADKNIENPHYEIKRVKCQGEKHTESYQLKSSVEPVVPETLFISKRKNRGPAIKQTYLTRTADIGMKKNFLKKLIEKLFGKKSDSLKNNQINPDKKNQKKQHHQGNNNDVRQQKPENNSKRRIENRVKPKGNGGPQKTRENNRSLKTNDPVKNKREVKEERVIKSPKKIARKEPEGALKEVLDKSAIIDTPKTIIENIGKESTEKASVNNSEFDFKNTQNNEQGQVTTTVSQSGLKSENAKAIYSRPANDPRNSI